MVHAAAAAAVVAAAALAAAALAAAAMQMVPHVLALLMLMQAYRMSMVQAYRLLAAQADPLKSRRHGCPTLTKQLLLPQQQQLQGQQQ
jgi:hypothetical protein